MDITEDDLSPGSECPVCEQTIVTYFVKYDELEGVQEHGSYCTMNSEMVEPSGLMDEWAGDTIVVDHEGPSME